VTVPTEVFRNLEPFTVRPAQRVFLDFDDAIGRRRWTNQLRDSLTIMGPPGYGKTSGLLIPSLLTCRRPSNRHVNARGPAALRR
jgi:hypothetical protein